MSVIPYENFEAFRSYLAPQFKASLEVLLEFGFRAEGFALNLKKPIPWGGFPRTFRFRMHAWDPISDLLAAHSHLGDCASFEVAQGFAFDWLRKFQQPLLGRNPADVVHAFDENAEESFTWYDMAIGTRIYRLAYIAEVIIRSNARSSEDRVLLLEALRFHHQALANPVIFRKHTNHGLYQALGQLAACRRLLDVLPSQDFEAVAKNRLDICLSEHFFTEEGIHKEHSPGYHKMVLGTLIGAREAGLLGTDHDPFLLRAEEALMWMAMPNSSLAPIGDTDRAALKGNLFLASRCQNEGLRHVASGGESGERPPSGVQSYRTAGYAFARIYDRDGGTSPTSASYLAQLAAFHSRVHKHADHLTFVWCEGPLEILTDPGAFGYRGRTVPGDGLHEQGFWYSDPARVYVESTRAHNCVEVDRRSFPRKSRAFGSGLKQADFQDGLVVFDSSMVLRPSLVCRRTLILAPGEFLLVIDWLADRGGTVHDFDQWFQMPVGWSVEQAGRGYLATREQTSLHILDLLDGSATGTVCVGQDEPMQGWISPRAGSLVPSPSFRFSIEGRPRASFATLFSLGGAPVRESTVRTNSSISRAILAWRLPDRRIRLDVERGDKVSVRRQVY
jgi:hypothetical protein